MDKTKGEFVLRCCSRVFTVVESGLLLDRCESYLLTELSPLAGVAMSGWELPRRHTLSRFQTKQSTEMRHEKPTRH